MGTIQHCYKKEFKTLNLPHTVILREILMETIMKGQWIISNDQGFGVKGHLEVIWGNE